MSSVDVTLEEAKAGAAGLGTVLTAAESHDAPAYRHMQSLRQKLLDTAGLGDDRRRVPGVKGVRRFPGGLASAVEADQEARGRRAGRESS